MTVMILVQTLSTHHVPSKALHQDELRSRDWCSTTTLASRQITLHWCDRHRKTFGYSSPPYILDFRREQRYPCLILELGHQVQRQCSQEVPYIVIEKESVPFGSPIIQFNTECESCVGNIRLPNLALYHSLYRYEFRLKRRGGGRQPLSYMIVLVVK